MQQQMHMNMMNAAQQQVPPQQQQQQRLGAPKPAGGVAAQVIIDSDDEDEGNTNGNGQQQQQQQGMNIQGMQGNPNMMTMVRNTNDYFKISIRKGLDSAFSPFTWIFTSPYTVHVFM